MDKEITIPKGYEAKIEGNKVVFIKKESEDERIRQALIKLLNEGKDLIYWVEMNGYNLKDAIAYLERQKEQAPEILDTKAFQEGVKEGRRLEKQEQKLAEWSKEDEGLLKRAISIIEWAGSCTDKYKIINPDEAVELQKFLKSLCPQPGLSKEDFVKFGNLEYERGRQDGIQFAEQTHWKPSEQQVTDLCLLLDKLDNLNTRDNVKMIKVFHWSLNYENLKNLLNDLKKL
jgi:hypothetical protein